MFRSETNIKTTFFFSTTAPKLKKMSGIETRSKTKPDSTTGVTSEPTRASTPAELGDETLSQPSTISSTLSFSNKPTIRRANSTNSVNTAPTATKAKTGAVKKAAPTKATGAIPKQPKNENTKKPATLSDPKANNEPSASKPNTAEAPGKSRRY